MTDPAVEVGQNTNREGSEGVGNRSARRKLHVGEKVDRIACCCDENHNRHLLIFGLYCEGREEDVEWNKEEVPVRV